MFSKESGILSRQLFRRILILSLIGVFGLIFAVSVTLFSTLRNIESELTSTGQTAAHTFDQFLSELGSDLLATGDAVLQADDTNSIFRHALERQFAIFELILLDPQGEILAQRRRAGTSEITQITEQPWLATIQTGQVYIGSVDFEEFGVPFVDMAVPVTDSQGQFAGTLLARVDMTTLWDRVIRLRVGQTGYSYITNESGQLLAYRDLQRVRNGAEVNLMAGDINPLNNLINLDFEIYQGVSGPTVAGTVQQLQSVPWFVVVEQPIDEALRPFVLQGLVLLAALLIVIALVVGIVNFVRHQIVSPLQQLRQGVDFLTQGELEHRIEVQTKNELGALASAFNSMAAQLYQFIGTLEERIHERTQALETSAEISRQITGILNLNELLRYVVNRLQADFGFYHTHVYLINNTTGDLEMVEGSGQVGQQLKEQGHRLQIGQGIVGNVARTGAPFLSENVDDVPNFFRNPLLPNTRSELSVPIRRGERILGVLDAQSEELDGFSQEDLTLLQSIADQVAVAVDNARLFQEVQEAAAEAEALNRRLTRETWQDVSQQVETSGYVFTKSGVAPAPSEWLPGMVQAVKQKELAVHSAGGNGGGPDKTAASVAVPLSLRGEAIGAIGIERPVNQAWTEDELVTIQTIAEQVALALDAARLAQETERAAWRDRVVSESTAKVWSSSEIEEVLRTAVSQLGDQLRASEVVIQLGTDNQITFE